MKRTSWRWTLDARVSGCSQVGPISLAARVVCQTSSLLWSHTHAVSAQDMRAHKASAAPERPTRVRVASLRQSRYSLLLLLVVVAHEARKRRVCIIIANRDDENGQTDTSSLSCTCVCVALRSPLAARTHAYARRDAAEATAWWRWRDLAAGRTAAAAQAPVLLSRLPWYVCDSVGSLPASAAPVASAWSSALSTRLTASARADMPQLEFGDKIVLPPVQFVCCGAVAMRAREYMPDTMSSRVASCQAEGAAGAPVLPRPDAVALPGASERLLLLRPAHLRGQRSASWHD